MSNQFVMARLRTTVRLMKKLVPVSWARFKSTTCLRLVYSEYGDPASVLELKQEPLDPPGPGKVIIKMLAAPINPADINTIQGVYPVKPPLPSTPGNEGVAQVLQTGEGVKNLKVGDLVLPRDSSIGSWRSHALCEPQQVLKVSSDVDVIAAATMSVNPCTAYRMLKDFVNLEEGDVVIQNGANSACGQSVIQFCRNWGYTTVNIVRNRSDIDSLMSSLKALGAHHILTEEEVPRTEIFKQGLKKPKLALNCVGGKNATDMAKHLDKGGVMVTYGGMSRDPVIMPTSAFIFKDITLRGFWMTRWNKENSGTSDQTIMLTEISSFSKSGKWKPPPFQLVPLESFKDILPQAMAVSGKTGRKFVFDLKSIPDES